MVGEQDDKLHRPASLDAATTLPSTQGIETGGRLEFQKPHRRKVEKVTAFAFGR